MPNLGMPELIIIFVLVMLLFGAKKIPELARNMGKSLGEFKKAKSEFEEELALGEKEGKKSSEKEPRKDV